MRDEKEERKKQARSNKQTRQSNTAHVQCTCLYNVTCPNCVTCMAFCYHMVEMLLDVFSIFPLLFLMPTLKKIQFEPSPRGPPSLFPPSNLPCAPIPLLHGMLKLNESLLLTREKTHPLLLPPPRSSGLCTPPWWPGTICLLEYLMNNGFVVRDSASSARPYACQ